MEKERLMELAGVVTEAEDKEEKDMMKCPLCDEEYEHGTVLKHIKADHKDARELVQDKMKEEDEKDDKKDD